MQKIMMTIFRTVVEGDGPAHRLGQWTKARGECVVHLIRCASGKLFEECEPQRTLLKHHERLFALSAHSGISFPMADLLTIVDVLRTFLDAGTVGDHNTFGAFTDPFSAVFPSTDEKSGQRTLLLENVLVDRLMADPFARHISTDPAGDLFRTPSEGKLLVHVVSDQAVGNTLPPSALAPASLGSHLSPVGLIPALFRAVVLDLPRYNRWFSFQPASDRSDAFAPAMSDHYLFAFFLAQDSVRPGGKYAKLHTGGSFGCGFR